MQAVEWFVEAAEPPKPVPCGRVQVLTVRTSLTMYTQLVIINLRCETRLGIE